MNRLRYFKKYSSGLSFRVNFALFNKVISSLSAKLEASETVSKGLWIQEASLDSDEKAKSLLSLKSPAGSRYTDFQSYLSHLFQAHEASEYWSVDVHHQKVNYWLEKHYDK